MKKSLIFALALMLVLAFASSAMAAQSYLPTVDGNIYYKSTATGVYSNEYFKTPGTFEADGESHYPYEIYLPNEENPASYRIHSNYAKNTDACASCHSTHTAVGNSLLQWYSVYETCMACHDGTVTTTYDVLSGKIGAVAAKATYGGAFGDGSSASNHNVTGALSISAAPGGTTVATETVTLNGTQTRWTPTFGCQSCHTPHGNGGNARILHPDPNYTATKNKLTTGYLISTSGEVYSSAPYSTSKRVTIIKGYPYTYDVRGTNNQAIATLTISNANGYSVVSGTGLNYVNQKVYGTAALTVKMDIDNYLVGEAADPANEEKVTHTSGMNNYCGACHTDYNTEGITNPSDNNVGTYSKAHRHTVGVAPTFNDATSLLNAGMVLENTKLECLTCHVAHGVNQEFWINTIGSKGLAYLPDGQLAELSGSSALKRIPNMGTCEACHQKGASNEGYGANSGLAVTNTADLTVVPSGYEFFIGDPLADVEDLNWVGAQACAKCHVEKYNSWLATKHYTAEEAHTASALTNSCAYDPNVNGGDLSCHNLGEQVYDENIAANGSSKLSATIDHAVTCEACHKSGAEHILSPSAKNIYNPGTLTGDDSLLFCARCHEGQAVTKAAVSPATFWDLELGYSHAGGGGFIESKHYTVAGMTCATCHDPHQKRAANGSAYALKLPYEQLCSSCHDTAFADVNLTMGGASRTASLHNFPFGLDGNTRTFTQTAAIGLFGASTGGTKPDLQKIVSNAVWNTVYVGGVTDVTIAPVDVAVYTLNKQVLYAGTADMTTPAIGEYELEVARGGDAFLPGGTVLSDIATLNAVTGQLTVKAGAYALFDNPDTNGAYPRFNQIGVSIYFYPDENKNARTSRTIYFGVNP